MAKSKKREIKIRIGDIFTFKLDDRLNCFG